MTRSGNRTIVRLALAAVMGTVWGAAPARAEEPAGREDLAGLVRRQGEQIRRLEDEVQRLRRRDRTRLEDEVEDYLAATEEDGHPTGSSSLGSDVFGGRVRVGGYFSLEFRDDGDTSNMTFDQHRLVLKVQSDVAEGIGFETEIEFEGGGAGVDFLDDNEILVEYAELSFEIVDDRLVFRAGAVLVPWGRFNSFHDDPLQDLTDRPLVSRHIGAVAFDQAGIGVAGTLEPGQRGWFVDYDLVLVQGFDDEFSTNGGVRDARQGFRSDNNDNKQVFGRFVVSPPVGFVDVLDFGTSFTYGKHDDAGDLENYGYAFDVFIKRGPVEFIAEYMSLRVQQPAGAPDGEPRRMHGWYAEVAYHIFPAGWRGSHVLFTEESTFTFVVRVEGIDLNTRTNGTTFRDDLDQVTVGFNFRPVERAVFKISYTFVDSRDPAFGGSSADEFGMSWASYF